MDKKFLGLSLVAVFAATSPALCQEVVPAVVEPVLPATTVPSVAPQIPIDAHRLDPSGSSELRLGVGGFFPTPPLDPIQISSPNFTYPSNAASTYPTLRIIGARTGGGGGGSGSGGHKSSAMTLSSTSSHAPSSHH